MTSSTGIDKIVSAVSAAYAKGPQEGGSTLAGFAADKIDIRHVPLRETDGYVTRETLAKGLSLEWDIFATVLDGFVFTPTVKKIDQDTVSVSLGAAGTVDGEKIDFSAELVLQIAGDQIVGMTAQGV